jgi:hypothetical protein
VTAEGTAAGATIFFGRREGDGAGSIAPPFAPFVQAIVFFVFDFFHH